MAPIVNASEAVERGLLSGASCAFGVFDGVHLGHRFLIDQAIETARESGGAAVALTFDVDPDELFHADRLKKLMGNERRLRALAETGADYVVVLTFTEDFAAQAPAEFLEATFGGCVPYALFRLMIARRFRGQTLPRVKSLTVRSSPLTRPVRRPS